MKSNTIYVVAKFEIIEHFKNKWMAIYGLSFFVLSNMIIYLGGANPLQASGSLLSLVLLLVPIFSLIFGSISFTESLPFMELMSAQPVSRTKIYIGKILGLGIALSLSFLIGMGAAALLRMNYDANGSLIFSMLMGLGVILSFIFISISFFVANLSTKKELVFGLVMAIWFYFFVLHDLIIFGVVVSLGDYPLEPFVLFMSFLNPIDLARVALTLQMDLSSLLGASGAMIKHYFSGNLGVLLCSVVLFLWVFVPVLMGARLFKKRDL